MRRGSWILLAAALVGCLAACSQPQTEQEAKEDEKIQQNAPELQEGA